MSIESIDGNGLDHQEMAFYGFDWNVEADRDQWLEIIKTDNPLHSPDIHDYSQDNFEFGSPPPAAEFHNLDTTGQEITKC